MPNFDGPAPPDSDRSESGFWTQLVRVARSNDLLGSIEQVERWHLRSDNRALLDAAGTAIDVRGILTIVLTTGLHGRHRTRTGTVG
jgi:hypothetical protein